jgi:hypothetical protein
VILPVFNHFSFKLLASTRKHSVLSHSAFKVLKLVLNFLTLSLLFIKLCLKLTSHSVVAVLGLFQVITNLMDVSESVQIFMLIQ